MAKKYNMENPIDSMAAYFDWLEGKLTDKEYYDLFTNWISPMEKEHGKVIESIDEAYGTKTIYDDGFVDFVSIGD
jgi:hypothetical protein